MVKVFDAGLRRACVAVITIVVLQAAVFSVWEGAGPVKVAARFGAYRGALWQLA